MTMFRTPCKECRNATHWYWEDAFYVHGFCDGDGFVRTYLVMDALKMAGYEVTSKEWDLFNEVIDSILQHGQQQIPGSADVGYDNPREYLPAAIVAHLDETLGNPVKKTAAMLAEEAELL